jgi:hypothetical protein
MKKFDLQPELEGNLVYLKPLAEQDFEPLFLRLLTH